MFFANEELIKSEYIKKNYHIINTPKKGGENLTIVYFSSNGIYSQNDEETFKRVIINENRYEWSKNLITRANKHIFVRDIYKSWYVTGINNEINSIDKLFEFLKEETKNSRIITLGCSSGGYAAMIFGILLDAEYIFSFSGQFSIQDVVDNNSQIHYPLLFEHKDDLSKNKYFNIANLVKSKNIPIFYFVSSLSDCDKNQINIASGIKNVYSFKIKSDDHGIPFPLINLQKIINMPQNELIKLNKSLSNKEISKLSFSYKVLGFKILLLTLIKKISRL